MQLLSFDIFLHAFCLRGEFIVQDGAPLRRRAVALRTQKRTLIRRLYKLHWLSFAMGSKVCMQASIGNVPPGMIKDAAEELSKPLCYLINFSKANASEAHAPPPPFCEANSFRFQ